MTIGNRARLAACMGALLAFSLGAQTAAAEEAAAEEESTGSVSGSLAFDGNTNFMSYGLDVWQTGNFNDVVFNPSVGVTWAFGNGLTANIGTWWDVNDNATSNIGGAAIQEVDVWAGVGYGWKKLSVSLTYQEWMYGGGSERILDLGLGLDMLLNPSLTVHGRVDGNGAQQEGAVFVLGVSEGLDLGPVALTFPVKLGLVTEDYYVAGQGGFGYLSAGVLTSTGLTFIPEVYGAWALNVGGTYYYTDPTNIANQEDNIFTMNFGIGVGF